MLANLAQYAESGLNSTTATKRESTEAHHFWAFLISVLYVYDISVYVRPFCPLIRSMEPTHSGPVNSDAWLNLKEDFIHRLELD